nr:TSUP family transporter [Aliamphritea spongicola]
MLELEFIFAYIALGSVVGVLAGLLGIGGGLLMVPALTSLFIWQGYPLEQVVHLALGTSMASIVLTSVSSMRAHNRRGG